MARHQLEQQTARSQTKGKGVEQSHASTFPQGGNHAGALQGYQMQLMLLEQEAMVASNPGSFTPESTPGGREQSVDSEWSTHFTPESTPGFPESSNAHFECVFGLDPNGVVAGPIWAGPACNCAATDQVLRDLDLQVAITNQQLQLHRSGALAPSLSASKWGFHSYQQEMMMNELRIRQKLMSGKPAHEADNGKFGSPDSTRLERHNKIMQLEEQNRKTRSEIWAEVQALSPDPEIQVALHKQRYMMSLQRSEIQALSPDPEIQSLLYNKRYTMSTQTHQESIKLNDEDKFTHKFYELNLAIAKQTVNDDTWLKAWREKQNVEHTHHQQPLMYYQMRHLLEQQKENLARQGEEAQGIADRNQTEPSQLKSPSTNDRLLQHRQMQLMLLEQKNKKRLSRIRQNEEASGMRNVKKKTGTYEPAKVHNDGPSCVVSGSRSDIVHHKSLVIREKPTCDD